MATTTTTAPAEIPGLAAADKAFMDSWYQAVKDHPAASKKYTEWGTALAKKPTYDEKLAYIRAIVNNTDSKYKDKIPPLAVNWLVESNPGIVDSKGDAFSADFYKGIISGDAKTQTANSTALKTAKTKVATESAKLANPKATPAELATIVADIVNGSSTKPYNPATLNTAASSTPSASLYKAGSMTADKLKSTYGNILDPDTGEPLFSAEYLNKIASATTASGVQGFNDTLSKVASKVLASQTGSNYLVQSDADKADALANLLKNPDKLVSGTNSLYKKSTDPETGINGLLPVGSFKDDKGNFVYNGGEIPSKDMSKFVQTYNNQGVANRGAYVAPTLSTSPYANALTSLLGSTKNPFASDYKSSLAQPAAMTSTQLASLNKPFKENTTARDIINLQNSAGLRTGNELTKGSSLSENLLGLYQTNPDGSAINSPWVADTDQMVIPTTTKPTIDTSTELVQLDPGGLLRDQGAVDPNLAANQDTAEYLRVKGIQDSWKSLADRNRWFAENPNDPYTMSLKTQGILNSPYYTDTVEGGAGTSGIDSLPGNTVANNAGIDTLSGSTVGGPAVNPITGKFNYAARNPTGFTANDLQLMKAMGWTPEQLKANQEARAEEDAKFNARTASTQRISNIIDSWKTPEDRWKWFAENPNDPYTKIISQDILEGKKPVDYIAPVTSTVETPPVVTDTPVVTNTSGVNPVTPEEIEARQIATDKLIAEQQAAAQAAAFKTAQDKTNDINQAAINQQIANDQQKVNESRDYLKSQNFDMSVFDANPNSQYRPVNTNAGIVTPNINNVVSEKNMNTFALGPNGETGIPTTLSSANTVNQNAGLTSLTGQQLENQAVNAGYQGDYTDTAAMQGYLSSLPR